MKTAFKIIGNYFLNTLALCLLLIAYIPNIAFQIYVNRKKRGVLKHTSQMQFEDALLIDFLGAKIYHEMWNILLIKETGFRFGRVEETISWYLEENRRLGKLTVIGWIFYFLILFFDFTTWTKGGHFAQFKSNINNHYSIY